MHPGLVARKHIVLILRVFADVAAHHWVTAEAGAGLLDGSLEGLELRFVCDSRLDLPSGGEAIELCADIELEFSVDLRVAVLCPDTLDWGELNPQMLEDEVSYEL